MEDGIDRCDLCAREYDTDDMNTSGGGNAVFRPDDPKRPASVQPNAPCDLCFQCQHKIGVVGCAYCDGWANRDKGEEVCAACAREAREDSTSRINTLQI